MKLIPLTPIGEIPLHQLIPGLWQVADIEKDGSLFDLEVGANELERYYQEGIGTFDMADHYGSATFQESFNPQIAEPKFILITHRR